MFSYDCNITKRELFILNFSMYRKRGHLTDLSTGLIMIIEMRPAGISLPNTTGLSQ